MVIVILCIELAMLSEGKTMDFCEKCDALLQPKRVNGKVRMWCPDCEVYTDQEGTVITTEIDRSGDPEGGKTLILEEGDDRTIGRPVSSFLCPRCNELRECEYWEIQTRSADESPTRFFKCLTCKKQWREYD